jgi:hypothetical protein
MEHSGESAHGVRATSHALDPPAAPVAPILDTRMQNQSAAVDFETVNCLRPPCGMTPPL